MKRHQIYAVLTAAVVAALSSGMGASAADQAKAVNFQSMLTQDALPKAVADAKAGEAKDLSIDLQGAVVTAIQNNRDIRISELTLDSKKAAVSEAAAAKNPSLDYSFQGGRGKTTGTSQLTGGTVSNISTSYQNGLTVTWPIWTFGKLEGQIEAARAARGAAEEDVYLTEANIKLSATEAYYQLLEAQNLEDVSRESVDNLTEHLTNVQQQYGAGIVAKLDVLSSGVSLANAKQSYISAENARKLAEANLNNVMRLPMNTNLTPVDKDFPQPAFDITMDQALAMARQYRWELIQADYQVTAAKEQLRSAKAGYLPTIAASGGYNWHDSDFPGFENEGWNVAGTVSWSLFDGGATSAKTRQAEAALAIAEESKLQADETIQLEVRQDYLNVISAREKIAATEAAVNEAEEAYKIAVVRYKAGVGINLDVLDAQLQLNTARTNYITALYDYNIGLATLEKAMGVPAVIRK